MINLKDNDGEERLPPVSEGDVLEDVKIVGTGQQGDGIAKVNGYVIFVPDTIKGDQKNIRITSVRNNFARAEII